jgi:beta-glucanase (GH16 family)
MRSAVGLLLLVLALGVVLAWASERDNGDATSAGADRKAPAGSKSRLLFRDDFDGSHLNADLWNTCHWWERVGCTIATNHELERYWPSQVRVGDGELRLVADQRGGDSGHPYASGMIASGPPYGSDRARFAFRFGTATIRAQIPSGTGLWPAFWLLPANRHSEPEIDVMEILGNTPDVVRMHLHYRKGGGRERSLGRTWTDSGIPSGWHTFSIRWRPRSLTWLVDGVPRFRVTGSPVPRKRMYPIANLAVGGDYPGPPSSETPFPSTFDIDYIEVRK